MACKVLNLAVRLICLSFIIFELAQFGLTHPQKYNELRDKSVESLSMLNLEKVLVSQISTYLPLVLVGLTGLTGLIFLGTGRSALFLVLSFVSLYMLEHNPLLPENKIHKFYLVSFDFVRLGGVMLAVLFGSSCNQNCPVKPDN